MQRKRAIVWFRHDLRLHDNESLTEALRHADEVIPVYVFDERMFLGATRQYGFPKTGKYRAKFILESVSDLREQLRDLGSELHIRTGKPEEEVCRIARKCKTSWVYCNRERTEEEVQIQDALERNLWSIGQELRFNRGKMLLHTADLPFPVTHAPDIFTQFRKEVEREMTVREPIPAPEKKFHKLTCELEPGDLPQLEDFDHEPFEPDPRAVLDFKGGEREGLKRLHYYLWESDLAATYEDTRNGLIGPDYSTKFSPWLAQGCLSPKLIYHELKRYEAKRARNKSTYWIVFELLWRDFFRLQAKKYGNAIYLKGGTRNRPDPALRDDPERLLQWIEGRTGVPFIDANMREIRATGFMSNRGRQNVASFLVKEMGVNWQMGAEYFESVLIDYDPASNWGNWYYLAGVGADPREDRHFNIQGQARKYDPHGEYVKLWVPSLASMTAEDIFQLYELKSI